VIEQLVYSGLSLEERVCEVVRLAGLDGWVTSVSSSATPTAHRALDERWTLRFPDDAYWIVLDWPRGAPVSSVAEALRERVRGDLERYLRRSETYPDDRRFCEDLLRVLHPGIR